MSKLIPMAKDGETINVNPLRVEDHKSLGWKVVEVEAAPAPEKSEGTGEMTPAQAKAAERKAKAEAKAAEKKAQAEAKAAK